MGVNLLAPVRGWEARRALKAARREADAEIRATHLPSPRLAWRIAELVADEHRVDLGRAVTGVVHASDERLLPGATPLDRAAVRACRSELLELASILYDLDRPVRPRGVLLLDDLLEDGSGPLYGHRGPTRLSDALARVRGELDGD